MNAQLLSEWHDVLTAWKAGVNKAVRAFVDGSPDHPLLALSIRDASLDFKVRTRNALLNGDCNIIADVLRMSRKELLHISGFGKVSLEDLTGVLESLGKEVQSGTLLPINQLVLQLTLTEFLKPAFVEAAITRKCMMEDPTMGSSTLRARICSKLPAAVAHSSGKRTPTVADLIRLSPAEIRSMAKLGDKGIRWLETYLDFFALRLSRTVSIYGMSENARRVLDGLCQ